MKLYKIEVLIIIAIIATIALVAWSAVESEHERERLYNECVELNENTTFECKAMAKEITRIDY